MRLWEWIEREGEGAKSRLHLDSRVSYQTIHDIVARRRPMRDREKARAISAATGGEVSVAELMGLDPSDERTGTDG